jgi:hypothetical protein
VKLAAPSIVVLCVAVMSAASAAFGQDMPDPSLIHGRALPAPELPNGTVTVRVVREAIGNNVPGQAVTVTVGSATRTATTDDLGRAEFTGLPAGQATAAATVDGEAMTSQPFEVPTTGGLRVILVAGIAKAAERKAQEEKEAAAAPAVKGVVVLGGNTRVLTQFNNDILDIYYVLDIVNNARTRVDVGAPIVITLPDGASGATALEGSSRAASVTERTITITGPFPSGSTAVQVGFRLPYSGDTLRIRQTWPIALQQVTVGVQKIGNLSVASPQFSTINEVRPDGSTVYALGTGAALPAGGMLEVTLSNLPHHSPVPRYAALALAAAVAGFGAWLAMSARTTRTDTRQVLVRRRDELLGQLTNLDARHRATGGDDEKYLTRRQRITSELEQIYGELDDGTGLTPSGGGEGVAA